MINVQALDFFKNIKNHQKNIDDNFEQPSIIIPTLRSYQRRAVKWMVDREKNNDLIKSDGTPFSGGILADEMGLGKTIEMLCCIASNEAPPEFYNQQFILKDCKIDTNEFKPSFPTPSTSKYIPYTTSKDLKNKSVNNSRAMLKNWYESNLNAMSTSSKKKIKIDENIQTSPKKIVECYCIKKPPKSTVVVCAMCGIGQHAYCVHFRPKPFQEVPFLCASCWYVNDNLPCKATLIVVPLSILSQWTDEIQKHVTDSGLKILIYNGVHSDGYIQPISFNNYDIVLTTYSNLSSDLNFVGSHILKNRNTRLRYKKKYNYPQSPIPCVKWWRICLDEGQAIENTKCKVSEMTSCLKSVHKWAMTGTPIQKSLNDLFGMLKFLDVSPYCNRKQFLQLMNGETSFLYSWFSNLIWRNLIEDVNSELNIPQLTVEQHWLTLSGIEKHYYLTQHDDCAKNFTIAANRKFSSLDIPVKNVDRKSLCKIIGPLYKLRQACVHPQAVNGEFLKIKGSMTMLKLMEIMIEKCRVECNDILRSLVSQHNAIAGLYLIRSEPVMAVEHYRIVLDLMEKYKDKQLKIDTCQKIHVMYNLTTILDENTEVAHALNDSNLKKDMEQLEKSYLDASKQNIEITRKTVTFYSVKVAKIIGNRTLSYSEWWSDMLTWIFSPKDFLQKVHLELEDYRVPGVPNIANKLKSINDVNNILDTWLADLDSSRIDTISILKTLEEMPMNDLVQSALQCHLRLKSKKTHLRNRCLLCQAESRLLAYESLLFSISNKQRNMSIDKSEEEDNETMYESTSKGLWKKSQKEFLLTKLFQYGQAKIINKSCLDDAAEHMKVLELVRKEFRYLRLLWTHLSDSLSAHDEIVMAKSRLRLGDTIKPEANEDGPPKKKTKAEDENDVVMEEYVDCNLMALNFELPLTEIILGRKINTLLYLENLKKEKCNSSVIEPCPICCLIPEFGWAVLQCGHSLCGRCVTKLSGRSEGSRIICPMCRNDTPKNSVSYVKHIRENAVIKVKGSCSTKIEAIVLKLMELIDQDPTVKVLIFSTWDKALNILEEALKENSINCKILKPGNKYIKTINDFKKNQKINALLMRLSLGSKGLNLTEATRVFFMEPIINKAEESQAIGRVHRIGQTKPTFVHHFIIQNSIEENITKIFSSEQFSDNWDAITLSQLIQVFERNETNDDN